MDSARGACPYHAAAKSPAGVQPETRVRDNCRRHAATSAKKGVIFFLHGFGLYADKFGSLYPMLNDLGYDVITHDARGHGIWVEEELTSLNIADAAEETVKIFQRFVHERPILMGVGTFGGFLMCKIMDAMRGETWTPPSVFYSVEYVPVPLWLLNIVQRPRLLRWLDRFEVGYDYRHLTHDAADGARFIEEDDLARARFPLGVGLTLGHVTNQFYEKTKNRQRHAFVVGTDDKISTLRPARRCIRKQPFFRLFEVQGGAFHMHRDTSGVRKRFVYEIERALDYVGDQDPANRRRVA